MDFEFTPEQDDAAALAARIFTDKTDPARLSQVEQSGRRFDADLWAALGEAGLLSLVVPEEHDGAGLGLIELTRVLVEAGRRVAPTPLAVHGPASLLVAESGTEAQNQRWLPSAAVGDTVLTAAVAEPGEHLPAVPRVSATPVDAGFTLQGTKTLVRAGTHAHLFLVTAQAPDGAAVFLVEPTDDGVTVSAQHTSDGDETALVELDGVHLGADRVLGVTDGTTAERLGQLLTVCAAAEQLGVVEGAVRLTADYAKSREQFGRPIATFQAVSQRLADGYIDSLFEQLVLWQAVWRLSEHLAATVEVATAKLWAADAGHRVAHTTVHVHGGVGIDLDGEAHRYFTAAKRFELSFGGATEQALVIGKAMAAAG